ncbi:MAG: histidine kinase [Peptococcaceae bacterium BICA1-7]|nr:MAG: histidine kinase [Peptococcaceae bacterium BICA1-7]HBV98289.1 DUF438 domain-containing protein [Desulfotomaculum sp.]
MSEYIQNREHRQKILKGLITDLHKGRDPEDVKREFASLTEGVDATEIAAMEQRLIEEGMHPEEIKKMCDVHAAVFKESLSKIERRELPDDHPLHTFKKENSEAQKAVSSIERYMDGVAADSKDKEVAINDLKEKTKYFYRNIDRHFSKKENIFFPYLERRQITGPPSVMWSVDDEIRDMLKGFMGMTERLGPENMGEILPEARENFKAVKDKLLEMFFKEEEILSPMMTNTLSDSEWAEIKEQSADFGEIFSVRETGHFKYGDVRSDTAAWRRAEGALELDTGALTPDQVNSILTNLPVDVTFVDSNDEVRYFSQGRERIFTRTKSIIGRKVQNCHPPESVHMVERIVNDFKTGRHSNARFWLELEGRFIHIEYTALRDQNGEYIGTMEVSQDITGLRSLEGERRLLQYSN